MEKAKPTPWEGKKKMFKDGDPDVFRGFNWQTWKNMTEGERAMWTESSEIARAPISKEVLDFKKTVKVTNNPETVPITDAAGQQVGIGVVSAPLSEIEVARAKLTERGIKFAYNSKLETLQKKLADADNTE